MELYNWSYIHPCNIYVFSQRYMYVSVYAHVLMQVHLHEHMCIHMCVLGKYVETCKDIHHVFIIHSPALYIHPCRSHSRSRPRFLSFSLDCSSSRALSVLSSLLLSFYLALYYFGKNTMVWHQAIQRWYREWLKGERKWMSVWVRNREEGSNDPPLAMMCLCTHTELKREKE